MEQNKNYDNPSEQFIAAFDSWFKKGNAALQTLYGQFLSDTGVSKHETSFSEFCVTMFLECAEGQGR